VSSPFGSTYSDAYDLLYSDKDYKAECDLIESLFRRYSKITVSTLLDLGCGTGNHAFAMSSRGYDVLGIDRSEGMLAMAQQRLRTSDNSGKVRFQPGDIRTADAGQHFDAALIMFAVLGYQVENDDVLSALKTARRNLQTGALLIFDVWYGPAVLHQKPSDRVKVIPTRDGKILRVASGDLDIAHHTCDVRFHLWRLAEGQVVTEIQETHRMRYFFPMELSFFLNCSGFHLIRLGAFPDFDKEPDESTWSAMAVAMAV
jgi:SAM-dependent methyltransferase